VDTDGDGIPDTWVMVGTRPAPTEAPGVAASSVTTKEGKININTATQTQLESLPGIGPKRAEAIIANRPYSSIEEITKAQGIGPKTYEGLKDLITVK
ncbi:ComEA family DNA-binding protein, partial [bacterium]|nr:ComEA family DNA-binding protein [bacterium]